MRLVLSVARSLGLDTPTIVRGGLWLTKWSFPEGPYLEGPEKDFAPGKVWKAEAKSYTLRLQSYFAHIFVTWTEVKLK